MALNVLPLLQSQPPAVTTYDYVDLANGTGITTYYLGHTSGAYIMSNNVFYSDTTLTDVSQSGTTKSYVLETDFDVALNLPRTLKGTAIFNIPIGVQSGAAGRTYRGWSRVKLRKWDGTTETEIAEASSSTWTTASLGNNIYSYVMSAVYIDITTPTLIKKGETIRVTIDIRAENDTGTGQWFFGHDPQNRATSNYNNISLDAANRYTFGTDPSILTAQLPFKIDTT